MSEPTPLDLPVGLRWVKLVCRLGRLVTDSTVDVDAHPDLLPVGGTLTLTALPSRVRIQEADGRWRSVEVAGRTYTIRADGELVDNEGRVGVYIPDPASPLVEPQGYAIIAAVKPTGGTEWRVTVGGSTVLPDVVDLVAVSSVGSVSPNVTASFDARIYALEAGGGGGFPVQRLTLTGYGPVDTSGWPTDQAVTLILTQDATGGHTVDGVTVDPAPGSVTVTAWVWTGEEWRGYSDFGTAAPASAPAWPDGMTATTGDPTDTDVVVTFSAAIPTGTLQVRFGASDAWRTITKATATTVTLSGLTASTAYAAPQFQVINSVGATTALSAQAFTTDAPPPVWTTLFYDSFTDADGTPMSAHTPDVGTLVSAPAGFVVITGGELTTTSAATATPSVIANAPTLNLSCRVTCDYDLTTGSQYIHPPFVQFLGTSNYGLSVNWVTNSRTPAAISGATETTGRTDAAPQTGTLEITTAIGVIELRVNGDLLRRWEHPEFKPGGTVFNGAQAINRVKVTPPYNSSFTPKAAPMDNLRIETLT